MTATDPIRGRTASQTTATTYLPKRDKKLLVIDDEEETCMLLAAMIARAGGFPAVAHSVREGRLALVDEVYDAVFLDIHLPDGLGYELIPDIRERGPNTRVIAISAVDREGEMACERGVDMFIPKPFDRRTILGGLKQLGIT